MSSPLCGLFTALVAGMAGESTSLVTEAQRLRVLRGLFDSYYADHADKAVVFDTNRMWTARLPALLRIFPEARIVCTVRDVAWIMDSIERLVRRNAFQPSRLFADDAERATVFSRVEALGQRHRLVGAAWSALKEAFYGAQADGLLVIDYEYLARAPGRTMDLLYEFLGEPAFAHDFEHIGYDEPDFDEFVTTPGLHRVEPRVRFTERRTILPPDLFDRYHALNFWTDKAPSLANLVMPRPEQPTTA